MLKDVGVGPRISSLTSNVNLAIVTIVAMVGLPKLLQKLFHLRLVLKSF
jgi:hypothetical protein